MNANTIVFWGKNGSGKTTAAVNLACALAENNQVVGLISSNLYFGEAQIHLNCPSFEDKGLHQALSDNTVNLNEQFIKSGVNSNIFLLTVPNHFDALTNTEITTEQTQRMLNQSLLYFDYVLIDGSAELQNPVTYLAMEPAHSIVTLYRPAISACLWHKSMEHIRRQLHLENKIKPVLNGYDNSCDKESFIKQTALDFQHELPYVPPAATYENSGRPIYYQSDKQSRQYAEAIDQLAKAIMERV